MAFIDSASRVHGHGAMGASQQDLSRPLAYDSDERREDFVPFRGLFRSSCGCLAEEIWNHDLGAGESRVRDQGYRDI